MKKLAIVAAAGLTLLAISTGVVLAGHVPGSGPSRMQLSAATDVQPTASPLPDEDEDEDADENDNDQDDAQGTNNHQGTNEPQGHNNQKDDDRQGATAQADVSQPAVAGQQGR